MNACQPVLIDPITLQPITTADLCAEIVLLERLIAASSNEFVERALLEVLWQRTHTLAALQSGPTPTTTGGALAVSAEILETDS